MTDLLSIFLQIQIQQKYGLLTRSRSQKYHRVQRFSFQAQQL